MTSNIRNTTRTLGLGLSLLLGTAAVSAIAGDFSGAYVGAGLGVGSDKASGPIYTPSKNAAAGEVEAGYNWDVNDAGLLFGVDAFYDRTKSKSETDSITSTSVNFGDKSYGIDGKIGYSIDHWFHYVKLGYARIEGTNDASGMHSNGPRYGAGTEYKFADHWSAGAEITHLAGRDSDSTHAKLTNNSLFFTLKYYFNSKMPVAAPVAAAVPVAAIIPASPAPAVAPVSKPVPPMEKYVLSATGLFGFDSAVLKMPQPRLDEIAGALNSNTGIKSVSIVGYTDRIGSDKYNQKLSEQRAAAVKNYLVSKGVDANRLKAEGKGKANPVVVCKDKNHSALVKCLEPNRRVEVEQITLERPAR